MTMVTKQATALSKSRDRKKRIVGNRLDKLNMSARHLILDKRVHAIWYYLDDTWWFWCYGPRGERQVSAHRKVTTKEMRLAPLEWLMDTMEVVVRQVSEALDARQLGDSDGRTAD